MKKGQLLALGIGLISTTYGANSFAYLIEWQTSAINNTSSWANNISILGTGFITGSNAASGSSSAGYANAESSFTTSNTGFDLFADVEVGVYQDGWFNANSNSNFNGSFIIRAESGEAASSSTSLTVDINSFVETTVSGSEPVFEIDGNNLGFDSLAATNNLNFNFNVDTLYTIYAYEYAVISDYFYANSTLVVNRPGEMNVAFNFKSPINSVPNPNTLVLFSAGLIMLRRKTLKNRQSLCA